MSRDNVRRMAETAIALALVAVLHRVKFGGLWPQGGSITAGSMIPIFLIALRWGPLWGVVTGMLASGIVAWVEPFFVHPVQIVLDYPVAFGVLGLAGLFPRQPVVGVVIAGALRFISHFLSGIVFFTSSARDAGLAPWVFSLFYNGGYMLPEIIISAILSMLLIRSLQRLSPAMW